MSNIEKDLQFKIFSHIQETLLHKSFVIKACIKMSNYLSSEDKKDLAILLLNRANIHDNSKLVGPELELLSSIYGNQSAFIDPKVQLSNNEKDVIEKHWENNRHHPEHFEDFDNMSELDILEMVCDWYARSMQYGTDFLEFVRVRQETRFHFSDEMFEKVYKYCEILEKNE